MAEHPSRQNKHPPWQNTHHGRTAAAAGSCCDPQRLSWHGAEGAGDRDTITHRTHGPGDTPHSPAGTGTRTGVWKAEASRDGWKEGTHAGVEGDVDLAVPALGHSWEGLETTRGPEALLT